MMYKKVCSVIIILIIILAAGCSEQNAPDELQIGRYVLRDSKGQELAWVLLEEENQFDFCRHIATSYNPRGKYEVKDGTLILTANLKEVYKFSIEGEKLILQDDVGSMIKEGAVFEYKGSGDE